MMDAFGTCAFTWLGVKQTALIASAYLARKLSLAGAVTLAYSSIALLLKIRTTYHVTKLVTDDRAGQFKLKAASNRQLTCSFEDTRLWLITGDTVKASKAIHGQATCSVWPALLGKFKARKLLLKNGTLRLIQALLGQTWVL